MSRSKNLGEYPFFFKSGLGILILSSNGMFTLLRCRYLMTYGYNITELGKIKKLGRIISILYNYRMGEKIDGQLGFPEESFKK